MQQKVESPQQLVAGSKPLADVVSPDTEPLDYDDGLLAVGGPIMAIAMGFALAAAGATFFAKGEALFAIVICIVYTVMFFGVPVMMTRIRSGHDARWCRDTPERRNHLVAIHTGLMRRHEAVLQMVIVPVGVSFAFAAFGLIWVLSRPW